MYTSAGVVVGEAVVWGVADDLHGFSCRCSHGRGVFRVVRVRIANDREVDPRSPERADQFELVLVRLQSTDAEHALALLPGEPGGKAIRVDGVRDDAHRSSNAEVSQENLSASIRELGRSMSADSKTVFDSIVNRANASLFATWRPRAAARTEHPRCEHGRVLSATTAFSRAARCGRPCSSRSPRGRQAGVGVVPRGCSPSQTQPVDDVYAVPVRTLAMADTDGDAA